jgi:T-complex protein 1 subunit gamma
MIELARAQDEEVGDGTTSVIILAGEILTAVEGFLERDIHPTVIVGAYFKALEEIVKITESLGVCLKLINLNIFIFRFPLISNRIKICNQL